MKRTLGALASAAILVATGCHEGIWFSGDFAAARKTAEVSDTLIMVDFYSDW